MSAGSKIFLAVLALFVAMLVVYYGLLSPDGDGTMVVEHDPAFNLGKSGDRDGAASPAQSRNATDDARRDRIPPATVMHDQPREQPFTASNQTRLGLDDEGDGDAGLNADAQGSNWWDVDGPPSHVDDARAANRAGDPWATPASSADRAVNPWPTGAFDLVNGTQAGAPGTPGTPGTPGSSAETTVPPAANTPASLDAGSGAGTRARADAAPSSAPTSTEYSIRAGDTFSSIAEEWLGSESKWTLIAKANPLIDPTRLQIGQKIRLPDRRAVERSAEAGSSALQRPGSQDGSTSPSSSSSTVSGRVIYTVKSGDTLSAIANTHLGSANTWRRLYDANRSTIGASPDDLKVGMQLVIPTAQ